MNVEMADKNDAKQPTTHHCKVCGYKTPYTTAMKKHLSSIKPCGNVDRMNPVYQEMLSLYVNVDKSQKRPTVPICKSCLKEFSSPAALCRHKKKYCKGMPELSDKVKYLEEKLEALATKPTTIVNQNCNTYNIQNMNNTQNNITINLKPFGEENIEMLLKDKHFMNQCVRRRDKGLLEFIEQVHSAPEHRNIKRSEKNPNYCLLYNGEAWMYETKDEAADRMLNHGSQHLQAHYKASPEEVPEFMRKHVKDFMTSLIRKDKHDMVMEMRSRIMDLIGDWTGGAPLNELRPC